MGEGETDLSRARDLDRAAAIVSAPFYWTPNPLGWIAFPRIFGIVSSVAGGCAHHLEKLLDVVGGASIGAIIEMKKSRHAAPSPDATAAGRPVLARGQGALPEDADEVVITVTVRSGCRRSALAP